MTLTITLPMEAWMALVLGQLLAAKSLQEGAKRFAMGKPWEWATFPGALFNVGLITALIVTLFVQNVQ